jgi:hypothetical protein
MLVVRLRWGLGIDAGARLIMGIDRVLFERMRLTRSWSAPCIDICHSL